MSRRKHGQKGVRYDPGATAEALIEAIAADLEEAQKRGDEEKARELSIELAYWKNRMNESGRTAPPMGIAKKPLKRARRARATETGLTAEQLERARGFVAMLTQPEQIKKIIHEAERKMGIIAH